MLSMVKKTEEKNDDAEPEPLKPHLYFRKSVPYEHEVIGYTELHPKIRDEIDYIRGMAKLSMFGGASLYGAITPTFVAANTKQDMLSVLTPIIVVMGGALWRGKAESLAAQNDAINQKLLNNPKQIFSTYFAPYFAPHIETKKLGSVIRELSENNQAPFQRADSAEVLKKYQYGIVDNQGNLVLLKHPQDESAKELTGWQMLKKMFAWRQPFQRTRFEIQKPKIKQEVKKPWERAIPNLLPAGTRLALAPVRLRRI